MEWEKQKQALRRRTYGGKTISADLEFEHCNCQKQGTNPLICINFKVDEQLKGWLIEIVKYEHEDRIHQELWHDLKELAKNILNLKVDSMTWQAARSISQRLSAKMKDEHPPKYAAFLVKILFAFAEVCRWLEYKVRLTLTLLTPFLKEYERMKDSDWEHSAFPHPHGTHPPPQTSPRSASLNLSPPTKPQIHEVSVPSSPIKKSPSNQSLAQNENQPKQPTQNQTKPQPQAIAPVQPKVDKNDVIICRVCDQPLRSYLLDIHTPYCTEKAAIEEQLRDLDVKMREVKL